MKIISLNLNGVRSAVTKGVAPWLADQAADVICFQEVKADPPVAEKVFAEAFPDYQPFWCLAEKKGYSGVATLVRRGLAAAVQVGCGEPGYDREGRVVRIDVDGLSILNVYLPSGTTGVERQTVKEAFLAFFLPYVLNLRAERPNLVVCGDFNIAHTEQDIHNPKSNQKTSGFLPQERAWLSSWIASGMVDTYRYLHPEGQAYSWWSQRAGARSRNLGWRLDYLFASQPLADRIVGAAIHPEVVVSDHCPVSLVLR